MPPRPAPAAASPAARRAAAAGRRARRGQGLGRQSQGLVRRAAGARAWAAHRWAPVRAGRAGSVPGLAGRPRGPARLQAQGAARLWAQGAAKQARSGALGWLLAVGGLLRSVCGSSRSSDALEFASTAVAELDLIAPVVQGRRNITGLQLFYSHPQRAQKQTSNGETSLSLQQLKSIPTQPAGSLRPSSCQYMVATASACTQSACREPARAGVILQRLLASCTQALLSNQSAAGTRASTALGEMRARLCARAARNLEHMGGRVVATLPCRHSGVEAGEGGSGRQAAP